MTFDKFVPGQVCSLVAYPGEEVEILGASKWRQGWLDGRERQGYFYKVQVLSTNQVKLVEEDALRRLASPRHIIRWEQCSWVPPEIRAKWRRRIAYAGH